MTSTLLTPADQNPSPWGAPRASGRMVDELPTTLRRRPRVCLVSGALPPAPQRSVPLPVPSAWASGTQH